MKIIGISGKAGSGKDTAGLLIQDYLKNHDYRVIQLSFAERLKAVCALMFNWDYERLLRDYDYKEGNTLDDGSPDPACEMLGMTRRVVMQKVGTECFREGLHYDTWIIALKLAILRGDYKSYDYGLLTDCRFHNELKFVKEMDGKLFLIKRDGERSTLTASTDHLSETEWESWTNWDGVITNTIDPGLSESENKRRLLKSILSIYDPVKKLTNNQQNVIAEKWSEQFSDSHWNGERDDYI